MAQRMAQIWERVATGPDETVPKSPPPSTAAPGVKGAVALLNSSPGTTTRLKIAALVNDFERLNTEEQSASEELKRASVNYRPFSIADSKDVRTPPPKSTTARTTPESGGKRKGSTPNGAKRTDDGAAEIALLAAEVVKLRKKLKEALLIADDVTSRLEKM